MNTLILFDGFETMFDYFRDFSKMYFLNEKIYHAFWDVTSLISNLFFENTT